jgi:3'(2'), 5'-bisphosphate nucleotidase
MADPDGKGEGRMPGTTLIEQHNLVNLTDHELAVAVADRAGRLLLELRPASDAAESFDPSVLRAAGDKAAHEHIAADLTAARPGDAVLSEEGIDDPARLTADRVWIVDPLDGTREFGEPGRDDWAVHVALWHDGSLIAGAVALPAQGVTLGTSPAVVSPARYTGGPIRMAVSRTRPPALLSALAAKLPLELVPMGSAGAKVAAVVTGAVDAYVHAGGQYEWDSAAPVAVAQAAGVFASRLDGSPLRYNQPDPLLPDLVVARPGLADTLLAAIVQTQEGGFA